MTRTETLLLDTTRSTAHARREPFFARLVRGRLERINSGTLTVLDGDRELCFGRAVEGVAPASIRVQDARFWRAVATRGSVGAGESYARGWWTSDDLVAVIRLFIRNENALSGMERGLAKLSRPLLGLYHRLRRNTERGSRENISAHYDLSNDFFALFLDETMTYSCGVFERGASTLGEASLAKIDRLCRALELGPDDHLLEIGTGWGALAIHAAREYGCRVTTTTISKEQHELAGRRVREAGLEDRITLLLEDYRKLEGSYDKLVSVEMIEAVGHEYFDEFFARCAALLRPGGRMALQAITIEDRLYDEARRSVDFIKRHVFPGCCIPSVSALTSARSRASNLCLIRLDEIGAHYVRTLAEWRANPAARADDARALGFGDDLLRPWDFYFAYCEGGFAERRLGDVQLVLERPGGAMACATC